MKPVYLFILLFAQLPAIVFSVNADEKEKWPGKYPVEIRDFDIYFSNCNVEGSVVIFDNEAQKWIVSDTAGIFRETLPASTFKIINLLIALESGEIEDENTLLKWNGITDTVKYGYRPEIYHDMSIKEAFEVSAVWAFLELAEKIGRENYKKYLALCNYGNQNLTATDEDFWNFGSLGISPVNQVELIRNLYNEKLPFSKRNMQIVKKVMLSEKGNGYIISAKTGWTREGGINTGWWVGYTETPKGAYFFATRLLQNRKFNDGSFGNCRKEITRKVFKELKIIE
jgi:beta-lactamase class D